MKRPFRLFRIFDLIPIAFALLIAGGFFVLSFGQPADEGVAVVRVEGKEVARLDLHQERTLALHSREIEVTIAVEQGTVSFQAASCPDQICVKTGKLSHPGDTAVCLPARISITIEGSEAPDAVTY